MNTNPTLAIEQPYTRRGSKRNSKEDLGKHLLVELTCSNGYVQLSLDGCISKPITMEKT